MHSEPMGGLQPKSTAKDSRHLIELKQVVKTYDSAAGRFYALHGIDLQVDKGEFVAVVGKSGSGKSTLLNLIAGIDRPTDGSITVAGVEVNSLTEGQTAVWRGRNIGVVFQFFQLLPTLTALENILLPMDFLKLIPKNRRKARAMELLDEMGVAVQAGKLPSLLSGGEQQRVAIARALANDPPVIAADEPTGNLDSATSESVFRSFKNLVAAGKTVLVVTHEREISSWVSRTVRLTDGKIVNGAGSDQFRAAAGEGSHHA